MNERLIERIFGDREAVGLGELARRLGFHPESLRRAVRHGRLEAVKLCGRWRVPPDSLTAFLQAGDPLPVCPQGWDAEDDTAGYGFEPCFDPPELAADEAELADGETLPF